MLLACWLVGDAVWNGRVLFQRDISAWWYPQVEAFVRAVADGSWPVWNPDRGFGQPLLADPSAQILYPFTWLNLVLGPGTYYTVFVVVHLAGSAFGLYRLVRAWPVSPAAAWTGGAVWMAGGPFLSLVSMIHHFASAAWIPWVFFATDRLAVGPARSRAVTLGAVMAAQIVCGSADMVAMTWLSLAVYVSLRYVSWKEPIGVANRKLMLMMAGAALFALTLSAAQWMTTLDITRRAARWNLPHADRTTWSLHPLSLLEIGLRFHWTEVPLAPRYVAAILDHREPWLGSVYLGLPTLLLVAAAAVAPGRTPRRPLLLLAGAATLVALGSHLGVYEALIWLLPPLRILRYPMKAMVPASFAVATLAALGVDAWSRGETGRRRWGLGVLLPALLLLAVAGAALGVAIDGRPLAPLLAETQWTAGAVAGVARNLAVSTAVALGALVFALARWRLSGARMFLGPIVAGVAVLDLATFHRQLSATAPRDLFAHRPAAVALLEPAPARRLYTYDYSMTTRWQRERRPPLAAAYRLARLPAGWRYPESLVLGAHMYLNPPTAGRWGVAGSYDLDMLDLYPAPLARLVERIREVEDTPQHLRLLQVGAVTNAIALEPGRWWDDLIPVGTEAGLFERPIRVFRVPEPLPRAYAVAGARIADGEAALATLEDPSFNPRGEVVLPAGAATPGSREAGACRITSARADRVRLEVHLGAPAHVVVVQAYDPGWQATVDGVYAPVVRANVAFCAVPVPAGRHEVELTYRPRSLRAGLLVSAAALAIAAVVCGKARAPA